MSVTSIQITATALLAIAIVHTFLTSIFRRLSHQHAAGTLSYRLFHILGEVELVFGLWAVVFLIVFGVSQGGANTAQFVTHLHFTEPLFLFVMMTIAGSQPILDFAGRCLHRIAHGLPLPEKMSFLLVTLTLGPLFGSFISEPAAMVITALILRDEFFSKAFSSTFKYSLFGILLVNVSIGGVLTPFAAPPVLMVAHAWNWDFSFMLMHFGWKAAVAIVINNVLFVAVFFRSLQKTTWIATPFSTVRDDNAVSTGKHSSISLQLIHLGFLILVVLFAEHAAVFFSIFVLFLVFCFLTRRHQSKLSIGSSALVGVFLAGLVVLGALQHWWLIPVINHLKADALFFSATLLTAFTDNAALTYLGTQIPNLALDLKMALVCGAVAGGGLTVIANAPNPAAFAMLQDHFGEEGIHPIRLFITACVPTIIAMLCLGFL